MMLHENRLPGCERMLHWQEGKVPPNIQNVYNYIDKELKVLKIRLSKMEKLFYGSVNPIQFFIQIEEIFKSKQRIKRIRKSVPRIESLQDLEVFIGVCTDEHKPGRDSGFIRVLETFEETLKKALVTTRELLSEIKNIYVIMQTFCQNYQPLEGEYDLKWAREINLELKSTLTNIENIIDNSKTSLNTELFNSDKLSLEIAKTCDTTFYPILRLAPDVFQKFHQIFYLLGRWRVSDQLYLEDIQFKLIKLKRLHFLKQDEYNILELEHSSLLSSMVEKRCRVKIREMRERLRRLDQEVQKLSQRKRTMQVERLDSEKEIQERKFVLSSNKNIIDLTPESNNLRKEINVLRRKHTSLTKSLRVNQQDLNVKLIEREDLGNTFETMRTSVTHSNRLGSEKVELKKDISNITKKIRQLEMIFFQKTDCSKLTMTYDIKNKVN